MIITRKQLTELEEAVGHSCRTGVLACQEQGSIAVRIWFEKPNGEMFTCEQVFTKKAYLNNEWSSIFEHFKHWAKRDFNKAFTS